MEIGIIITIKIILNVIDAEKKDILVKIAEWIKIYNVIIVGKWDI